MHGRQGRGLIGRWDEQQARRVLAAWRRSGQSAYAFSREQGIDPQRLYWWRRRLGDGGEAVAGPVLVPAIVTENGGREPGAVVRVGDVAIEIPDTAAVSPTWVAAMVDALLGRS